MPQQKADNAAYDSTRGKALIDQSQSITDIVAEVTARFAEYVFGCLLRSLLLC